MSFLMNLRSGLGQILGRMGRTSMETIPFEIRVNNWEKGTEELPEYGGQCFVTPQFLVEFWALCEKHECGEQ